MDPGPAAEPLDPPADADAANGAADAAAHAAADAAHAAACSPPLYLIVYNVSKRHNIGTLLRCATAFAARAVCLVGAREYNSWGAHGSEAHVPLRHYASLEAAAADLKGPLGCRVVGVEIAEGAVAVQRFPWAAGPVALMLGNEGAGLSERQARLCDAFVCECGRLLPCSNCLKMKTQNRNKPTNQPLTAHDDSSKKSQTSRSTGRAPRA